MQGFINDMVGNTDPPTMIEDINKATMASKLGKAKPVIVHENNHGDVNILSNRKIASLWHKKYNLRINTPKMACCCTKP